MVKRINEHNIGIATVLNFAILPLTGFATDIYLPSLPTMAASLHVSNIQVQTTLTVFLVSYGISQLFIGSVLDSFGRYRISLAALVVFALAGLVIANTNNIWLIYAMRMLHGITAAAVVVAKRTFFVDVYKGEKLKHYLSLFSIVWSTGPIIAPFAGGYLQANFGWQSNFYLLSGLALVFAVLEYFFNGESLPEPAPFSIKRSAGVYGNMLGTPSFSLGLLVIGLSYSMVMVYNMTGPFIIEHHLHFTPVMAGYCSLILGFAWMAGGFIGKAAIRKPFLKKLSVNLLLQICLVGLMLLSIGLAENIYTLVAFAFLVHACAGFAFNVYFTYCLSKFPTNAGIASGLTGGIMYVIVSAFSYGIVWLIPAKNQLHLGYSYLVLIALSALIMWRVFVINRRELIQ